MGQSPAGLFGFSHMLGGYLGGQAEYLRVPMADVGPIKVPETTTDEQALFLSDIFPTGYMAAVNAQIQPGDTVAIWGCGPVGQFAIRSALMLGAGRVIAIDEVPERLAMAEVGGAEIIDFSKADVHEELMRRTDKRGPDSCIDAVGCEASGHGSADAMLDKVKATLVLDTPSDGVSLKEFFLLLSSPGLAYRRCQLEGVNGSDISVSFLKPNDKRNRSSRDSNGHAR